MMKRLLLVGLVVLFAGAMSCTINTNPNDPSGVSADSYEPDDAMSSARGIATDGTSQTRTLHTSSDQDWISFSVSAGYQYVVRTAASGTSADTYLAVYDGYMNLIAANDDYSGLFSQVTIDVTGSGTLYAKVTGVGGDTGGYAISISATAIGDAYEPDSSYSDANSISVGVAQEHSILAGDYDWMWLDLTAGFTYTFETSPGTGTSMDTHLSVYASDGTTLLTSNDDSGTNNYSLATYTPSVDTSVYIVVRGFSSTTSGTYRITVRESLGADSYEPDGTMGTATSLAAGVAQYHTITAADHDIFYFSAVAGNHYTVTLESVSGGVMMDTQLAIFNSTPLQLGYNDNATGYYSEIADLLCTGSETWYVEVWGFNDSEIGDYAITMTSY